jgi:membrane fusion protein (multidrug efflux system)
MGESADWRDNGRKQQPGKALVRSTGCIDWSIEMNWHRSKPLVAMILLAVVSWMGCGRRQASPAPPIPEVAVVTIEPQKVVLTSELPGRTSGYLVAEIRPQVNGLLQKRLFKEGSDVKAGQVLYEIDPAPYQSAYDNAAANLAVAKENVDRARAVLETSHAALKRHQAILELAETNLLRYQKLVKTQAVSAMQRDQAEADVDVADSGLRVGKAQVNCDQQGLELAEAAIKQAEAALKTATINLGYTKITAPISGRIGRSAVTEGAIVTAYQPLAMATIQQLDPIFVDVPQSTVELNRLKRSLANGGLKENGTDDVKIILEDGTAYQQDGSLKFRDITVDPTTGSVILRIVVPNPDGILLPGMFVRAVIDEGVNDHAILVPQQAVTRDPKGNPYTMIVQTVKDKDEKKANKCVAKRQSITTDRVLGAYWLVSSGISEGDRVIVEGLQKVRPEAEVKVVPLQSESKNAAKPQSNTQAAASSK